MIQFENDKIWEIYRGSDKIKEVYYGSILVWVKRSYMILTNGTRVGFNIQNTPIANFCVYNSTSIIINGVSYTKSTIKEIHFGVSYSGVTQIGGDFLFECSSLTNVTINFPRIYTIGDYFLGKCSSLINVTINFPELWGIGNYFLYECSSLTDVTLDLPKLYEIGRYFLYKCSSLTDVTLNSPGIYTIGSYFLNSSTSLINITLTTKTPPTAQSLFFLNNTPNLTSIYVPANSVNLYKTTSPWSIKASLIKAI